MTGTSVILLQKVFFKLHICPFLSGSSYTNLFNQVRFNTNSKPDFFQESC